MESYTVLAGDGECYGPVGFDDLVAWKAEGRLSSTTKIRIHSTGKTVEAGNLLGPDSRRIPPNLATPVPRHGQPVPSWAWLAVAVTVFLGCIVFPGATVLQAFSAASQSNRNDFGDINRINQTLIALARGNGTVPDLSKTADLQAQMKPYLSPEMVKRAGALEYNLSLKGKSLKEMENPESVWTLGSKGKGQQGSVLCFADAGCRMMGEQEYNEWVNRESPIETPRSAEL